MQYSKYQKEIFREVAYGNGNLVIMARAGVGKSATIIESLKFTQKNKTILCTAFNKSIAEELKQKTPAYVDCQTFHSTGFKAIKNKFPSIMLDEYKVNGILEKILEMKYHSCIPELKRTISLAKLSLENSPDQILDIIDKFGVDYQPMELDYFINKVIATLGICKQNKTTIDFDDMVWYPFVYDMYIGKWDYIFVDEFQDLNHAQLNMVKLGMKANTRVIMAGDPRQSCYSFAAVKIDVIENFHQKIDAKMMPLPLTYRCPKSVVNLAKEIVPDYECPETAIEGNIQNIKVNDLLTHIKPGSYFLSRYNAPLVRYCMMFIKHNIPANIQGRDIGNNLLGFVNKFKSKNITTFLNKMKSWKDREIQRLTQQNRSIAEVVDRYECFVNLCEEVDSITQLKKLIQQMFIDVQSSDIVTLSTIHRIKGKQSKNVFVLADTLNKGGGQEEDNLYYIAITRSSENLYFVVKD